MSGFISKYQHPWSLRIFLKRKHDISHKSSFLNDYCDWWSAFLQNCIVIIIIIIIIIIIVVVVGLVCTFLKSHKQFNDQQPAFECHSVF